MAYANGFKNKLWIAAAAFFVLAVLLCAGAAAETGYTIDAGGVITHYSGNSVEIEIPGEIDGISVKSIGELAFADCTSLKRVVLPAGVSSIDYGAFRGCTSLESITFRPGLKYIGESAFFGCGNLREIAIPEGVSAIEKYTFYDCSNLASVALPDSLESIGDLAFYNCAKLNGVDLSKTLSSIGYGAFQGCSSLVCIEIPAGITAIGNGMFRGCSSLQCVILPGTLELIGANAFEDCTALRRFMLPAGVKAIGNYAFSGCAYLNEIVLPAGLTAIGNYAFSGCGALGGVVLPAGVASVGDGAFGGNDHMRCVIFLGAAVPELGANALPESFTVGCSVGSGVESWAKGRNLRVVDVSKLGEESVLEISLDKNLLELASGETQQIIARADILFFDGTSCRVDEILSPDDRIRFSSSNSLVASVDAAGNVSVLNAGAAEIYAVIGDATAVCKVVCADSQSNGYPESEHPYADKSDLSWTYTHPEAAFGLKIRFSANTELEEGYDFLYIVHENGDEGKYTGKALAGKTIMLQGGSFTLRLVSDGGIRAYGFAIEDISPITRDEYDVVSYTLNSSGVITGYTGTPVNVEIPSKVGGVDVTGIGASVFAGCTTLEQITLPQGVRTIGNSAFEECSNLRSVVLPQGFTVMGKWAFYNCVALEEITMPQSLTTIGYAAFDGCASLKAIEIPKGIVLIDDWTFNGCASLKEIRLPEELAMVGKHAFSGCAGLSRVTFPKELASIGNQAFQNCPELKQAIFLGSSLPTIGRQAFDAGVTIGCMRGSAVDNWAKENGYGVIYTGSVNGMEFKLPAKLASIEAEAFAGADVQGVEIPDGCTSIGSRAFADCDDLEFVYMPDSVKQISDSAFAGSDKVCLVCASENAAAAYARANGIAYLIL